MIKKSLCTWWLQYNHQVHRDFLITLYIYIHTHTHTHIYIYIWHTFCRTFPNYNDRVPYSYQVHKVSSNVILQDKLSKIIFCQTWLRQCYTNISHIYLDHCSLINFILLPVSSLATTINTKLFPPHQMTHHSECLMPVAHMMSTNETKISSYIYVIWLCVSRQQSKPQLSCQKTFATHVISTCCLFKK